MFAPTREAALGDDRVRRCGDRCRRPSNRGDGEARAASSRACVRPRRRRRTLADDQRRRRRRRAAPRRAATPSPRSRRPRGPASPARHRQQRARDAPIARGHRGRLGESIARSSRALALMSPAPSAMTRSPGSNDLERGPGDVLLVAHVGHRVVTVSADRVGERFAGRALDGLLARGIHVGDDEDVGLVEGARELRRRGAWCACSGAAGRRRRRAGRSLPARRRASPRSRRGGVRSRRRSSRRRAARFASGGPRTVNRRWTP